MRLHAKDTQVAEVKMLVIILEMSLAACAILAAMFWLISARVKTPQSFSIHVVKPETQPFGGNAVMGGEYMGNAYSEDINNLAAALIKQSRWSSGGALFGSLSAILLAVSIGIKYVK